MTNIIAVGMMRPSDSVSAHRWPAYKRSLPIEADVGSASKILPRCRPLFNVPVAGHFSRQSRLPVSAWGCATNDDTGGAEVKYFDARLKIVPENDNIFVKSRHLKLLVAKAGAFGIEVQELRCAFRHICGIEIHKALRALRTDEVKRRLDTDASISVAAAMRQCGFGSHAYFRKKFQNMLGVDPKELCKVRKENLKMTNRLEVPEK
jgi:AraC-like DNA-binding protein